MKPFITIAIIATIGFTACEHKEQVETTQKFVLSDSMLHMIRVDTVRECPLAGELPLSGEVSFNENNVVKIFPRSAGQVIESRVSLGDRVSKGQVLAVIKSADIAGFYNDLSSANADVSIAKRQMDNAESLYKNGISSEKEYNEAKQNYGKALAARNKIQALININSGGHASNAGQYSIVAPINGYVVEKKIAAGSYIRSDMADNLFTISDMKNVWINANVYEADISKVKEGDLAKVIPMAYPDKVFTGKIEKVSQVLDPQSKAMQVRISLNNSDMLLKPQMFVKVVVNSIQNQNEICVPSSAIISQDNKNYVVVYNSTDNLQVAEVDILKTAGEMTYLKSGVTPGQLLVTRHQLFIFNQLTNE